MSFPLLSANIYDADGRRAFTPYRLFELPGLTVAVLGLTTESTAVIGNPEHTRGLTFRSAIDEARELVPMLRRLADVVVALAHLGFDPEGESRLHRQKRLSLQIHRRHRRPAVQGLRPACRCRRVRPR